MSKEEFLQDLQEHLEILEDREQQDILEEYAQHIDIKIQNGQSEEDAIRDFGPVKELAAEILEAYHVKPEFGENRKKKGLPGIPEVNLKVDARKLRGFGDGLREGFRAFQGRGAKAFRRGGQAVKSFFVRLSAPLRKENRTKKKGSGFFRSVFHGIAGLIGWCLRLCWNLFWLLLSLGAGCLALTSLFGFGLLLLLAFQKYPLGGAVLVCLGFFLTTGSVSGLCFSLIRRKGRQEEPDEYRQEVEA